MSKLLKLIDVQDELLKMLPHGSGINGDWTFEQTSKLFVARNFYHVMDENGYYDGKADFKVSFPRNQPVDSWYIMFKFSLVGQFAQKLNRKYNFRSALVDSMIYAIESKGHDIAMEVS